MSHRLPVTGALGSDDQHTFHVFVAVTAILGAENWKFPGRGCNEFDRHWIAATGHLLADLELLDLDAVHAVTRLDDETDALAFGDLDARRFECESLRHDFDRPWLTLREVGTRTSNRVEGRRSRGGVLKVRHCCRPQQERRPRRGN